MDSTTLTCLAPRTNSNQAMLMYTLMLDGAVSNDSSDPDLIIAVRPNPSGFVLDKADPILIGSTSVVLQINVRSSLPLICEGAYCCDRLKIGGFL